MKAAIVLALAALTLAACAPPGIDPEASEAIKQKYIAKIFGGADAAPPPVEAEEADLSPTPPPPPIVNPPAEGITITGISLTGYWRINTYLQMSFGIGPFHKGKTDLGELADRDICELIQVKKKVRALCLRKVTAASGRVDDDALTLEWSTGPGTLIYEGQVKGDGSIEGVLGVGVLGVRVSSTVPANLYKLSPSISSPGPAPIEAALRKVLEDLDRGSLTEERYSAAALVFIRKGMVLKGKLTGIGLPESLLSLGAIQHRRPEEKAEKSVSVYEIHSPGKKTLCGISLDEDGLVTDFMCSGGDQT